MTDKEKLLEELLKRLYWTNKEQALFPSITNTTDNEVVEWA